MTKQVEGGLSERAVLTTLRTGVWSGMAHDDEVSGVAAERFKASATEAGTYVKRLVARKFLNEVAGVARSARATHRILTLPWMDDGTRIMSTRGHEHYTEQMRTWRIKFEETSKRFIRTRNEYVAEAQQRLGKMFNIEDYPGDNELRHKFSYDVEISKVPEAGDFRAKMSDDTAKAIIGDIEQRTEKRMKDAMNDAFQRIFDVTSKMHETLKGYQPAKDGEKAKGNFQGSLITNVKEVAEALSFLNITGDDRLDELQAMLKADLVDEISPEVLKTDGKLRHATAKAAEALAKRAKAYMG